MRYTGPTLSRAKSASAEPRCGVPIVVRLRIRLEQVGAESNWRASSPPMLWPIMWTDSPGKAASICSSSRRARRLTPAIGGTRVTTTRLPLARRSSGMPRK